MREKPLIVVQSALSNNFGIRTAEGMRLACTPYWPEHWSPDWAISSGDSFIAWSELDNDGFTMRIYFNTAHTLLNGLPEKLQTTMLEADSECNESLYYCLLSAAPLSSQSIVRGRGTISKGKGKGKGAPAAGRGSL